LSPSSSVRLALVALLAGSSLGCIAFDQHLGGPAVWPFIFAATASDPDVPVLQSAAGVTVIVPAVEVGPDPTDLRVTPLAGGALTVDGPGLDAPTPLVESLPGLYGSLGEEPTYVPGATYEIRGTIGSRQVGTLAPAAEGLRIPTPSDPLEVGQDLRLPMPSGYAAIYDQVLVSVTAEDGATTYSNTPVDAEGWLRFASGQYTPTPLVIPRQAFPIPGGLYAVKVVGLVRARQGAERTPELRSELSGFTTGSGVVVPVWTSP